MTQPPLMSERAAVLVIDQDEVLLMHRLRHGEEYYVVPGGGMEAGEDAPHAAVREIKEETGLDIVLGEQIGTIDLDGRRQHLYAATSFFGEPKLGGPELERQTPENIYKLVWIPIEDIGFIPMRTEVKEMLVRYLENLAGPRP